MQKKVYSCFTAIVAGALLLLGADISAQQMLFHGSSDGDVPTDGADGMVFEHLLTRYGDGSVTYMQGAQAADDGSSAVGFDAVIISSTLGSGTVRNKYEDAPLPVLNWEQALTDSSQAGDFFLAVGGRTNGGSTSIDIVDSGHFITSGLEDGATIEVVNPDAPQTFSLGTGDVAPGVQLLANLAGSETDRAIMVAEKDAQLLGDGSDGQPEFAADRRAFLFIEDNTFSELTDVGLQLFDRTVDWILRRDIPDDITPGDFNSDGVINLADYEILTSNFNMTFPIPESATKGDVVINQTLDGRVDLADFAAFRVLFADEGAGAGRAGTDRFRSLLSSVCRVCTSSTHSGLEIYTTYRTYDYCKGGFSMRIASGRITWFALMAAVVLLFGTRESSAQLVVNRSSGAVTFAGAGSDPLEVNGYSIASEGGLLNPETWNSLTDQSIEGWSEANPRNEMLTELNPFSSTNPVGNTWNLGNAYSGTAVPPSAEDVTVQYSLTDGSVVDGEVQYIGAINDFVLRVDPLTGNGNLELMSANVGPFDVTGYSILSESGSLAVDTFTGIGEAGWTIANPQATALADLNLEGSKMFTTNSTASLGTIWTVGSEADLRFEYSTVAGDLLTGTVAYGMGDIMPPGDDCNGDGVVDINDANCTPNDQLDAFLAGLTPPSLRGDSDGDGVVQFSDLVTLSTNFGQPGQYTDGDFDKLDDTVQFGDLVILSTNFGQSGGAVAAAVPEPSTGLLAVLGLVGLTAIRRMRVRVGHCLAACLVLGLFASFTNNSAMAQIDDGPLTSRFVRIGIDGANNQINNTREAIGILRGTVTHVDIVEDISSTVDLIDYAGDAGTFTTDYPYLNGVADASMDDFTMQVTGAFLIPEGDWTIGFNTDDGGYISMPRVDFTTTGGENGSDGNPGEIIFNGTRGFNWTYGQFSAPAGGLRTEFEFVGFERGGGDGFEVAHVDGFGDGTDLADFGFEVADPFYNWEVIPGPGPGDFNWDDAVNFADFTILADNFGTGTNFAQGDMNQDGVVDLVDFSQLVPLLEAPAGAGVASVPEPGSLALLGLGGLLLAGLRRRRR